jgi:hypothetical protein
MANFKNAIESFTKRISLTALRSSSLQRLLFHEHENRTTPPGLPPFETTFDMLSPRILWRRWRLSNFTTGKNVHIGTAIDYYQS